MSLFSKILKRFSDNIIRNTPDQRILVEAAMRRGVEPTSKQLQYEGVFRSAQNLKKWKDAIGAATDPESPSKAMLWEFYDNLLLDNHLRSCIDTRIAYVQRKPFKLVDDKGNENPDNTWLVERPWVEDLIHYVLMSRFQGATLLELFDINEKGELTGVNEIPSPFFNAKLGIISKEKDDNKGWLYRERPFNDFYIQVGKDNDLGELERIGPIVLAKKLALGAYQDFVEKYGVPPLFITTDREDETRLNELFEAAKNFKSNSFMVGRGQETFNVGNVSGMGTAPFLELMQFANDELSKAILGGTGLNGEKSFVGSANIQMELATNRFKSDALFFKYIFNEEVKPRLVKLSPLYQPLEKLYFDWDESEELDMQGYIAAISTLSSQYTIDYKQIEERTGIKILGEKAPPMPLFNPTESQEAPQKQAQAQEGNKGGK